MGSEVFMSDIHKRQSTSNHITDGRFFGIGLKYNGSLYWETGESTEYLSTLDITPANQDDIAEGYINSSGNMNVGMLVKHPFICEWDYD